ncbi:hypothetical protein N8G13_02050 [Mycoplasma zalophi]|uniref:hypothetical protein n=1 Tax=Mycoplasma zalophi TaxID=191287 RepID=UPI0021C6A931|nr:hypothetical protein [Mycoplasma zalophi]MCU4117237.1 hypothetical protein [Mycoplasma zalophi]
MKNWKEIKKWATISIVISSTIAVASVLLLVSFIAVIVIVLTKETNILQPWWEFLLFAIASLALLIFVLLFYISPMQTIRKSARKNTITKLEVKAIKYHSSRLKFVSLIYHLKIKKLLTDNVFKN